MIWIQTLKNKNQQHQLGLEKKKSLQCSSQLFLEQDTQDRKIKESFKT